MNKRLESIKLMKQLQPFLQGGILSAKKANEIAEEFIRGNFAPLEDFMYSPDIPVQYAALTKNISNLLGGNRK